MEKASFPSFTPALHQNTSLEELVHLDSAPWRHSPQYKGAVVATKNILARNRSWRRADLLLVPRQPRTLLPIAAKSGIWCMAFAKMTSNDGQSKEEETINTTDDSVSSNESQSDYEEEDDDSAADNVTYSGASAIFKILQARPAILQPLLQRPTAAAAATSRTQSESSTSTRQQLPCSSGGGTNSSEAAAAAAAQRCNKRRRL
jgi:hypothetical protein